MEQIKRKRETAGERRARMIKEAQEREALKWAEFRSDWLLNLLNLVYEYGADPELSVVRKDEIFLFNHPEERWSHAIELPLTLPDQYDWELIDRYQRVKWELEYMLNQRRQAEEQYRRRQAALNKLTAEERQMLGL